MKTSNSSNGNLILPMKPCTRCGGWHSGSDATCYKCSTKSSLAKSLPLLAILLLSSCSTTKPNVDLTITDGKATKRIVGRLPVQSDPISFVFGIGTDALKYIFPAL